MGKTIQALGVMSLLWQSKPNAKVLVLAGDRDLIERAHTEYIAKEIPKSKLKIFKDTSHGVPIEKADELNQDVIQFIKK